MLPASCGVLSLLHWLGDPPMVTHHENGCFEWQLEVTLASNLPWSVRCLPAEDHVHLSHSAFSPLAFDRMAVAQFCALCVLFSLSLLASQPACLQSHAGLLPVKQLLAYKYSLYGTTGFKMHRRWDQTWKFKFSRCQKIMCQWWLEIKT